MRALIQVLLEAGGLTVGREPAEVQRLSAAVACEAAVLRTPFDEAWLASLFGERGVARPAPEVGEVIAATPSVRRAEAGPVECEQDWGTAPDVLGFVGRLEELAALREWVLNEGCRLVAVLGMRGIGKMALAARLGQSLAPNFPAPVLA